MLFTGAVVAGLLLLAVRVGPGSPHSDESPSHGDEDHWTDARAANSVVLRWLHDSPGTPTITVPREEVAWLKELTASAARQADVHQPKRPGPEDRTPPPIDR